MKPLRGALLGYGFIAERGHVPAYLAQPPEARALELVAVADHVAARRALARARLPGARVYDSCEALLAAEHALDFVDVALPPSMHASAAHAALDRGLHVLCEKPLCTTVADARALLEHARRARRVVFPCHNYKHAPVVRAVRRVLDAGLIGDVSLATLHTFRPTHARGVSEWRPDWRRERQYAGGGIGMDHGSHTFYLALEWLRAAPTAVSARAWRVDGADTGDNLACSVDFPTGIATAHLTWTAGVRKVIYTLHGARGALRVEDDDLEVSLAAPGRPPNTWAVERSTVASAWMDAGHADWFAPLHARFVDAIARGEWAGPEALEALRCVELISAAYASAAEGGRQLALSREALA